MTNRPSTIHTIYSIERCRFMIRNHEEQARNMEKPARWRELHTLSVATWRQHLERAEAFAAA